MSRSGKKHFIYTKSEKGFGKPVNNVIGTNNCWPTFFGKSPNSALKFEWFNTNIVWILKNVELILGHD